MAGGEPELLDPASYLEDWDLILDKVIKRRYPLSDGSGRTMAILVTGSDAYGRAGVTDKAYSYWRKMRGLRLDNRFYLLKGERPKPNTRKPLAAKTYPDNTSRSDRAAKARGDVPVWILNTTALKDSVYADMLRTEPGPRYMHFPEWLPFSFYEELTAEIRSEQGWDCPPGVRNETFDLKGYAKGITRAYMIENRMDEIDWDNPPAWAAEWDNNSQVDLVVTEKPKTKKASKPADDGHNPFASADGWEF